MTFEFHDLSVLAYSHGTTLWKYEASQDDLAEVSANGFFDDALEMFSKGDILLIRSKTQSASYWIRSLDRVVKLGR